MNLIGLIGTIGIIFGAKTLDFPNAENQIEEKLSNLGFTTTEIERMSEEEKERFINNEQYKH